MRPSKYIPAAMLVATLLAGCSSPGGDGDRASLEGQWVGRLPIGDLDTVTVVLDLRVREAAGFSGLPLPPTR